MHSTAALNALRRLRVAGKQFFPLSRLGRAVFLLLLALGIFLRVAGLDWGIPRRDNASSYYHDEGHQLALVLMDWKTFRQSFGFYELTRPVLLYRLVGRPLLAAGRALGLDDPGTRVFEIATLRSINAAFAIGALLATYAVGRKVSGTAAGLWALAFLAVMPGHWYYAQVLKGDILVATFFALALLIGFRIVEWGDNRSYLAAGLLLGFGASAKVSALVAAPFFLLAHLLRTLRERRLRFLVGRNAWLTAVSAVAMFALWYPYPWLNWPLFAQEAQKELWGPNAGFFSFQTDVSPAVYANVWRSYMSDYRPFLDMVFGRFLRSALIPAAAVAAAAGMIRWRRGDVRLLLVVAFAALFYHSLTFIAPFDDRYVVPSTPFVAVMLGAIAAGTVLPMIRGSRIVRAAGGLLGAVLFLGTAAITAATFPAVGGEDPREAAIGWIARTAPPGALVAQPTHTGRWSLVLDRTRVTPIPLIHGEGQNRRVMRLARPELVAVQREPWNYDHTFRYELEGVRGPFAEFLRSYDLVRTFGRDPVVFGGRLPRNMGLPVIDIYRQSREPSTEVVERLTEGPVSTPAHGETVQLLESFSEDRLRGNAVRITLDFQDLTEAWRAGSEPLRVGLLALWDEAPAPTRFRDLPGESTFLTKEGHLGWLVHLRPQDLRGPSPFTLVIDHPRSGQWDVYDGWGGTLQPRGTARRDGVRRVRFAVAVLSSGPEAGAVRLTDAVLERVGVP